MGVTEWVMLAAAVAAVLMIYLISRRNNGPNPWEGMDSDAGDELPVMQPKQLKTQAAEQDKPDVIVDPAVAGEWGDFTPDPVEPLAPIDEPARDVDDINPATLRKEPSLSEPEIDVPSEAMLGFVSEARPVSKPVEPPKSVVAKEAKDKANRLEPKVDLSKPIQASAAESIAEKQPEEKPVQHEQKIVVLHIVRLQGGDLEGPAIHKALESCDLQYGDREVYHRMAEVEGASRSVFSVANMLKPGTLKPDEAEGLKTKGLVMFMVLPGPVDGNKAFHDMLNTAQGLAEQLDAKVLDDKRLPLTRQAAQYQIDEIAELKRRHRLAEA